MLLFSEPSWGYRTSKWIPAKPGKAKKVNKTAWSITLNNDLPSHFVRLQLVVRRECSLKSKDTSNSRMMTRTSSSLLSHSLLFNKTFQRVELKNSEKHSITSAQDLSYRIISIIEQNGLDVKTTRYLSRSFQISHKTPEYLWNAIMPLAEIQS